MRELITRAAVRLQTFQRREEGVTVMEYGVTVALVSLVVAAALATMGGEVMTAIGDKIDAALGVTVG